MSNKINKKTPKSILISSQNKNKNKKTGNKKVSFSSNNTVQEFIKDPEQIKKQLEWNEEWMVAGAKEKKLIQGKKLSQIKQPNIEEKKEEELVLDPNISLNSLNSEKITSLLEKKLPEVLSLIKEYPIKEIATFINKKEVSDIINFAEITDIVHNLIKDTKNISDKELNLTINNYNVSLDFFPRDIIKSFIESRPALCLEFFKKSSPNQREDFFASENIEKIFSNDDELKNAIIEETS